MIFRPFEPRKVERRVAEKRTKALSERQQRLLHLAAYIDAVCEEHEIWYSLAAGSVLGAVRHRGFIPWDNDMDIFVKNKDMARFRAAVLTNLPAEFKYYAWDKEPKYHPAFDRLAYSDASHYDAHVDIFPLIGVPEGVTKRRAFVGLCFWSYKFFRCKHVDTGDSNPRRAKLIGLLKPMAYVFSDSLIKRIQRRMMEKYDLETSSHFYYYASGYGMRTCMPKELVLSVQRVPFEGIELNIPLHAHEYLSRVYGDYMTAKREGYKVIDKYLR